MKPKVVILCGGLGTRLEEETENIPKPMVQIGNKPILWHIMKIYSYYGFNDFILCLGYKGYIIKEYFINYFVHNSDLIMDLSKNKMEIYQSKVEPWKINLVDTGLNTMTGGRIKRIKDYVGNKTFMLTYGDGVGNININKLLEFHESRGKNATISIVQPSGRFGVLNLDTRHNVISFKEKPKGDLGWVNGGFFVLEPRIFDYLKDDECTWEKDPLENLARDNQLVAYKHFGFWKPMDTLRDKKELQKLWEFGNPPWKVWKDS